MSYPQFKSWGRAELEAVEQRRKVERIIDVVFRLAWWATLIAAGYIAANIIRVK